MYSNHRRSQSEHEARSPAPDDEAMQGLKRHMSMSASIDPFDDFTAPLSLVDREHSYGHFHRGRAHRRSRSENLTDILSHFDVKAANSSASDQSLLMLLRSQHSNSFDLDDCAPGRDDLISPSKVKKMIDDGMVPSDLLLAKSSPRDLADAGMMQLASAMGPDIEETETDGITNSSSSPKKASILAEAQQLSGGRDNHSELPTESNDTDMSVHVELGLDHSDGGAASPRSENRMKTNTNTNALGVAFKARQYSSSSSENTGIYSRQTPFASTAVVESPNGYGGLFGSQSISMSMDLGDISSSRLAFSSVDWHDMMSSNLAASTDNGSPPRSPEKSPRSRLEEEGVIADPNSWKKLRPNDGIFSSAEHLLVKSMTRSPSLSSLVAPVQVLSIQQDREYASLESAPSMGSIAGELSQEPRSQGDRKAPVAMSAAPVRMGAPTAFPTGALAAAELSRAAQQNFLYPNASDGARTMLAPVSTILQPRISDTVYHRASSQYTDNSISSINSSSTFKNSRGKYKCGRCGAPKVNHVCEFTEGCSVATQVELSGGFAANVSLNGPDKVLTVGGKTGIKNPSVAPIVSSMSQMSAQEPAKPQTFQHHLTPTSGGARQAAAGLPIHVSLPKGQLKNAVHYLNSQTLASFGSQKALEEYAMHRGEKLDHSDGQKNEQNSTNVTDSNGNNSNNLSEDMLDLMTPTATRYSFSNRTGSAELLPPLFSAPLGMKGMPSVDTVGKAKPINFAHSFDILDIPSYDVTTMASLSQDDFDNI